MFNWPVYIYSENTSLSGFRFRDPVGRLIVSSFGLLTKLGQARQLPLLCQKITQHFGGNTEFNGVIFSANVVNELVVFTQLQQVVKKCILRANAHAKCNGFFPWNRVTFLGSSYKQ
jgi:hypothetical protein